jgi:GDP-L-fucose synthase
VVVWGTGTPRREFLYVDDLAEAAVFLMNCSTAARLVNVGVGEDISIGELAEMIREIAGFEGAIRYDTSKPDGTPRKLLDVSLVNSLGWRAKTGLREGIAATYRAYAEGSV